MNVKYVKMSCSYFASWTVCYVQVELDTQADCCLDIFLLNLYKDFLESFEMCFV